MLFGSLFSGYVMLRTGSDAWSGPIGSFPWLETLLLVGASAAFGSKRSQLVVSNTLGLTFVVIKVLNDVAMIGRGITPSTDSRWAFWFALTGVHALHVLAGAIVTGWLAGPPFGCREPEAGSREPIASDGLPALTRQGATGCSSIWCGWRSWSASILVRFGAFCLLPLPYFSIFSPRLTHSSQPPLSAFAPGIPLAARSTDARAAVISFAHAQ